MKNKNKKIYKKREWLVEGYNNTYKLKNSDWAKKTSSKSGIILLVK
jgi:hypothetical protein